MTMTVDEYLVATEGERGTQLIEGVVVVNQPKWTHQRIEGRLYARLLSWVEAEPGRGQVGLPVDVVLDEHNVYGPDVWWLCEARKLSPDDPRIHGAPDLVIEIRSESTWRYDIGTKAKVYERSGVGEIWLVDTAAESVLVFRRSEGSDHLDVELELRDDDQLASPLLPGFSLSVASVFAP